MRIKIEGRPYVIHQLETGVYACDDFNRAAFTHDDRLVKAVTDPSDPDHDQAKRKFINLFDDEPGK